MIAALFCAAVIFGSLDPLALAKLWAAERLGPTEFRCLDALVQRESGWRVDAVNRKSGAWGLGQSLPGSKMARYGDDWRTSPMVQLHWMVDYVERRYGGACSAWRFWQRNSWY